MKCRKKGRKREKEKKGEEEREREKERMIECKEESMKRK